MHNLKLFALIVCKIKITAKYVDDIIICKTDWSTYVAIYNDCEKVALKR